MPAIGEQAIRSSCLPVVIEAARIEYSAMH